MLHPAALPPDELATRCRMETGRKSGPGGQHRNKVETAVRLIHEPTGIAAQCSEFRTQSENRRRALSRLRRRLAIDHREKIDLMAWAPSPVLKSRIHGKQLALNARHEDFPAVLAEVMDLIHEVSGNVAAAGRICGLSTSQVVRLLSMEPEALARVNEWRAAEGMPPMKP